ncbi:hypothetical protein MLD38_008416 [Melastoma candidum]|uniref:Uncharacterized protein n=1 Tax=Melastoma candidum TaxID=119954 RepID=A0ACB9RTV8_9MYRT|nr:hypothetical protein MLD38_008416 [Melastoma candidum]
MEGRTDEMALEVASLKVKSVAVALSSIGDVELELKNASPKAGVGAFAQDDNLVNGLAFAAPSFKDVLKGTSIAPDLTRPGTSAAGRTAGQHCQEDSILCHPEFGSGGKLLIPAALADLGADRWRHTLVGYLLGKSAPYPVLRKIYLQLWQKKGLVEVGLINKGAIILRFDSEQYLEDIVGKADWHLAGCPLLLRKWQVGMPINEEPTALPCWVRLYDIPLELWHSRGVQYLVSSVGQLLKTDARSFNLANMGTARVQIECAAKNGLSKKIEAIDSRGNVLNISIVYETKALCCKDCGVFGHEGLSCHKRQEETGQNKAVPDVNLAGKRFGGNQQTRTRWRRPITTVAQHNKQKDRELPRNDCAIQTEAKEQASDEERHSHVSLVGVDKEISDEGEYVPESELQRPDEADEEGAWSLLGGNKNWIGWIN